MSDDEEQKPEGMFSEALQRELDESGTDASGAGNEALQFSSGKTAKEIEDEAREKEAARQEKFRDHFENIAIASLYLVWVVICLVGLVWVYHLVSPESWPRLPEKRIDTIQAILTGGVVFGVAGQHLKKRVGG
ncbi:MAG: hypothetical protein OXH76_15055 [Boseongicola sp.]|nr:hypothetical protein [Boseongicola sp.]